MLRLFAAAFDPMSVASSGVIRPLRFTTTPASRTSGRRDAPAFSFPTLALEVVGNPEPLTGGIVHLPGGLLRVLEIGNLLLDLPEFNLDLTLEVLNLLSSSARALLRRISSVHP